MIYVYFYYTVLTISFFSYIKEINNISKKLKYILFYLLIVVLTELFAALSKYNLKVYLIGCPVQYLSIIFFYSNGICRPIKYFILFIGVVGCLILLLIMTYFFILPNHEMVYPLSNILLKPLTTYFFMFEGFYIIFMSLLAYYFIFSNEFDLQVYKKVDFWITTSFFIFWCIIYLYNGISNTIVEYNKNLFYTWVFPINCFANYLLYGLFGILPILYKRNVIRD